MKTKTLKQIAHQISHITSTILTNGNLDDGQKKERLDRIRPLKKRYSRNAFNYIKENNLDDSAQIPLDVYAKP